MCVQGPKAQKSFEIQRLKSFKDPAIFNISFKN